MKKLILAVLIFCSVPVFSQQIGAYGFKGGISKQTLSDSLGVVRDTLAIHDSTLAAINDTLGVHLDTLRQHDDRLEALEAGGGASGDSIAVFSDTLKAHDERIDAAQATADSANADEQPADEKYWTTSGTAGETISAPAICFVDSADGKAYLFDADSSRHRYFSPVVAITGGVADAAITLCEQGYVPGLTGLVQGMKVWASTTAGGYTCTMDTTAIMQGLGEALSATEMRFDPDQVSAEKDDTVEQWMADVDDTLTSHDARINNALTGNETITLSGDVSGSGTTAITTAVADDSHSHTSTTLPVTTSYLGSTIEGSEITDGTIKTNDCDTVGTDGLATQEDIAGFLTSEVDGSTTNEIEVVDEAYNSTNFDGGTTSATSQDDFYDFQHTGDTDDDALVNKVDLASAGFVKTDASGVLSSVANIKSTDCDTVGTDGLATQEDIGSFLTSESDPNALLSAGTDNVKDTHIDWGTGAGQVDVTDLESAVNILLETEVDASSELASIMDDETGTAGSVVFSIQPILTVPISIGPAAITSFAGTVSSSGTVVTFSSAADAILAGYNATVANQILGTCLIAGGQTKYIMNWTNATTANVLVAPSPAWSSTAITSIQYPTSVNKTNAGTLVWFTAANGQMYFANNIGLGTTSATNVLTANGTLLTTGGINLGNDFGVYWSTSSTSIRGSSASNSISFFTSSAEKMRFNGNLSVGTILALTKGHFAQFSADANGVGLTLSKARSATAETYTILQNNDENGFINFASADGTDVQTVSARIRGLVHDSTPGPSSMGGALEFWTAIGAGADDITLAAYFDYDQSFNMITGKKIKTGSVQWTHASSDYIDGAAIADGTIPIAKADTIGGTGFATKEDIINLGSSNITNGTIQSVDCDTVGTNGLATQEDLGLKITLDTDASIVLTAAMCVNAVRINNDADAIDYTLPPCAEGLCVQFGDIAGGVITIDAYDGTDTIYLNYVSVGAGDAIDSPGVVGDYVTLIGLDDTRWLANVGSGVWVDGGAD